MHSGSASSLASASFSTTAGVLCYDTGSGTCIYFDINGGSVSKGNSLTIQSGSISYIAVSDFSATTAVVCYRDLSNSDYGTCNHLTVSGTSLTKGADLIVNSGTTDYITVGYFGDSSGIVCYRDSDDGNYGKCHHIAVSGTTLSIGADFTVNPYETWHLTFAHLTSTSGIVCYNSNNAEALCNLLALTNGTTLNSDASVVVNEASTWHLSVSAFDASSAVICYQDAIHNNYAICNYLGWNGTSLSRGDDVIVNSAESLYVTVATFDDSTAFVCYRDNVQGSYGICNHLSAFGTTLAKGEDIIVNTGTTGSNTGSLTAESFTENTGLFCYQDASSGGYATCNSITKVEASVGSYCASPENTTCFAPTLCPVGTSSNVAGVNVCPMCSALHYSSDVGATTCDLCTQQGKWLNAGRTRCMSCPKEKWCRNGACVDGRVGDACPTCTEGWYALNSVCVECPADSITGTYLVLSIVLILGFLFFSLHEWSDENSTHRVLQSVVTFTQLSYLIFKCDFDWPIWCLDFVNRVGTVMSLHLPDIASLACYPGLATEEVWLIEAVAPLLPLTIFMVIGLYEHYDESMQGVRKSAKALTLTLSLLFVPSSMSVWSIFDCTYYATDTYEIGGWRLNRDPSITCFDAGDTRWMFMLAPGLSMLLLYSVGPIFFAAILTEDFDRKETEHYLTTIAMSLLTVISLIGLGLSFLTNPIYPILVIFVVLVMGFCICFIVHKVVEDTDPVNNEWLNFYKDGCPRQQIAGWMYMPYTRRFRKWALLSLIYRGVIIAFFLSLTEVPAAQGSIILVLVMCYAMAHFGGQPNQSAADLVRDKLMQLLDTSIEKGWHWDRRTCIIQGEADYQIPEFVKKVDKYLKVNGFTSVWFPGLKAHDTQSLLNQVVLHLLDPSLTNLEKDTRPLTHEEVNGKLSDWYQCASKQVKSVCRKAAVVVPTESLPAEEAFDSRESREDSTVEPSDANNGPEGELAEPEKEVDPKPQDEISSNGFHDWQRPDGPDVTPIGGSAGDITDETRRKISILAVYYDVLSIPNWGDSTLSRISAKSFGACVKDINRIVTNASYYKAVTEVLLRLISLAATDYGNKNVIRAREKGHRNIVLSHDLLATMRMLYDKMYDEVVTFFRFCILRHPTYRDPEILDRCIVIQALIHLSVKNLKESKLLDYREGYETKLLATPTEENRKCAVVDLRGGKRELLGPRGCRRMLSACDQFEILLAMIQVWQLIFGLSIYDGGSSDAGAVFAIMCVLIVVPLSLYILTLVQNDEAILRAAGLMSIRFASKSKISILSEYIWKCFTCQQEVSSVRVKYEAEEEGVDGEGQVVGDDEPLRMNPLWDQVNTDSEKKKTSVSEEKDEMSTEMATEKEKDEMSTEMATEKEKEKEKPEVDKGVKPHHLPAVAHALVLPPIESLSIAIPRALPRLGATARVVGAVNALRPAPRREVDL